MKNITFITLIICSSLTLAQQPSQAILDGIKQLAPTATITSSNKSVIAGVTEIVIDSANSSEVFYMTDDGKYLISGSIIETASRKDVTEEKKSSLRKDIVQQFDKDQRMDFYPKDMKHHVTVYTDIDCGYCRKLHSEMKQYNDLGIGISYLLYPRSGIGSKSYDKAVTAWCAVDRNEAMTQSQNGEILPAQQCDNPVKAHYASGRKVGVKGTPNIVTDSGLLLPTYMPPEALLQKLNMLAAQ